MADRIAPIRLGSRVSFEDRWQGRVSGIEVDENWNVYNISVSTGFLFASSTVRLPFTSVTEWSDRSTTIAANSFRAFGRDIPPVATPARPLDASTPVSHPGTKFAGAIVKAMDRKAVEIILSKAGALYRVPVTQVTFSGKTMSVAVQAEQLARYYPDASIHDQLHAVLAEDRAIPTDDKMHINIDVEDGVATISGNVRVEPTVEDVVAIVATASGVVRIVNELRTDFEIEADLGSALSAAGANQAGKVYVRSNLGEVQVDGFVNSERASEDIVRTIARVTGVRNVVNRLQVRSATAVAR